jgi:hypothetical protein
VIRRARRRRQPVDDARAGWRGRPAGPEWSPESGETAGLSERALGGLAGGFVVAALIPSALARLPAGEPRPGESSSWWAWTVLATLTFLPALAGLADPTVDLARFVLSGVLLLVHPDSRARIDQVPAGRN